MSLTDRKLFRTTPEMNRKIKQMALDTGLKEHQIIHYCLQRVFEKKSPEQIARMIKRAKSEKVSS